MAEEISRSEWEQLMRELCERHRWTLLDNEADALDAPFSPFIKRIVDHKGRPRILKVRDSAFFKVNEHQAMLAFRASRRVPKVKVVADDGLVMLIDDLGGLNLHIAQRADEGYVWRAAKLVRRLHRLPTPDWALPLADFLAIHAPAMAADIDAGGERAELALRAQSVLEGLLAGPSEGAFLHGDFHPRNIVVSRGKLWAIDPFGLRGDRAYDIALLAAHHADPLRAAARLAERYEDALPRLEEWLAVCCYRAIGHLHYRKEDTSPAIAALRALTPAPTPPSPAALALVRELEQGAQGHVDLAPTEPSDSSLAGDARRRAALRARIEDSL